jgi:hypothetical protein
VFEAPQDIGHGVVIEFYVWPHTDPNHQDKPVGLVEAHPRGDNPTERCSGTIRFDTPEAHAAYQYPGAFWQVQSWDPLTVSPSLLCSCGNHGFIREGKWVPA